MGSEQSHPQKLLQRAKKESVAFLLLTISTALVAAVLFLFFHASPAVCVVLLIISRLLYQKHKVATINFARVNKGIKGERLVGEVLKLLPEGWIVNENVALPGLGDADFFLRSPNRKAFVLEVKAHSGQVDFNGVELVRINRGNKQPFEKDFLTQVARQSNVLSEQHGLKVTPVLVFTSAKVICDQKKIADVYLLECEQLLQFLQLP